MIPEQLTIPKGVTMAQPKLTVESFAGSTQVSIEGLLQLMVLDDGSVQIDLAGKRIEVERNMSRNQIIVRHEAATQVIEPAKTLVSPNRKASV